MQPQPNMKPQFEFIYDLLEHIAFGTLATASADAKPWNSPVIMVHDDDLNFYWFSDRESQHGQNVRANPHVFVVIYDSTVPPGEIKVDRGFYFEAIAREVDEPEIITRALELRRPPSRHGADHFAAPNPRRVYQATPTHAWINDIERQNDTFVRDIRIELPLEELKDFLRHNRVNHNRVK